MINYRDIKFNEISIIKELWERNRKYHENISENFGSLYSNLIFEDRINSFSSFDENHIKITIAENKDDGKLLGYCISTFEGSRGEPQTLHVLKDARGNGIGRKLMEDHLKWLKVNGCSEITITVSYENYNTIEFYKSLGFSPNTIEMRMK